MKNLILLNIYDDNNNIIKQAEATPVSIKFGAVRKLMKLLKIEDATDTWDILTSVSDIWEELTALLSKCFPDMTEKDWDEVRLEDLIPAVISILRMSFGKMNEVPGTEEKN